MALIKDLNGNHVVQRCLQRLGPEDSQFIYDAAGEHCVEVASHRHGCCVLQVRVLSLLPPCQVMAAASVASAAAPFLLLAAPHSLLAAV